jgi:hypothetical protein
MWEEYELTHVLPWGSVYRRERNRRRSYLRRLIFHPQNF